MEAVAAVADGPLQCLEWCDHAEEASQTATLEYRTQLIYCNIAEMRSNTLKVRLRIYVHLTSRNDSVAPMLPHSALAASQVAQMNDRPEDP